MTFEEWCTTAEALDCFGNVVYRLRLRFDGIVEVRLHTGTVADVEPRTGTVLTPGVHLDPVIIDQCRQLRP